MRRSVSRRPFAIALCSVRTWGQTFALVATGNAELGLVAASQHHVAPAGLEGSAWLVPESLHQPIRQDAVLLVRAEDNPAALAFLDYLTSQAAQDLIRQSGYSAR